jgi:hypothetical protein
MKQTVRETVVRVTSYESGWPPSNLLKFADWLADKIDRIPEECRANSGFDVDREDDCDPSSALSMRIYYYRLETDEEKAKREDSQKIRDEEKVASELRTLAYLKAKYEQPKPDNI